MKSEKQKSQKFSIYLVKESEDVNEDFFLSKPDLSEEISGIGRLYVFSADFVPPKWLALFLRLTANSKVQEIRNRTNSAVFCYESSGRKFLLAFGYGRSKINLDKIEDDFGIKCCINMIDDKNVREVERQSISSKASKKKEQSLGNTDIADFDIEEDSDLLRSITGKPSLDYLGKRVSGSLALSLYGAIGISEIIALSPDLLNEYSSTKYKAKFGWIDKIKKIISKSEVDRLDWELIQAIPKRNAGENIWAGIPEIIDWSTFDGFAFKNKIDYSNQSDEFFDDPSIELFLSYHELNESSLSIDKLKSIRIYSHNENGPTASWSFYQCLYFEKKIDDTLFVLTSGSWYRVESAFYDELTKDISALMPTTQSQIFTECNFASEPEYNTDLAPKLNGQCLDDVDIVPFGWRNNIEACDIYRDFEFIHIKIYGGSPVLSHLFNQGSYVENRNSLGLCSYVRGR